MSLDPLLHTTTLPLNGIDIGMPLNIIDNIFTNLHYGYDITTLKVVLLQFLIGYYTYGKDRYKDAVEYIELRQEGQKHEGGDRIVIAEKKKYLYQGHWSMALLNYRTRFCLF